MSSLADCNFTAIDVETANHNRGSICQIGVVEVESGVLADKWSTLVNPEGSFSPGNIRIHGIEPDDVADAPTFADIADKLREILQNRIVVSHTFFDLQAVRQAKSKYGIAPIDCMWLDSADIARRGFAGSGILNNGASLKSLCSNLGILFNHHNALEDARACAQVVLKTCEHSGRSIDNFL